MQHTQNAPRPAIRFNGEWVTRPLFGILLAGIVVVAIVSGARNFAVLIALAFILAAMEWHRCVGAGSDYKIEAAITAGTVAIALAAFLGPSLQNAMIAIGITATPIFVRVSRAATMDAATNDYVEAARALGNPPWRVAFRHVLPNIVPPIMVQATLAIAGAIIAEASLSFLGLGQQPPAPSWGSMLNSAQRFLTQAPWLAIFPGAAIFLAVFSFNLIGDGLRDALDPRAK